MKAKVPKSKLMMTHLFLFALVVFLVQSSDVVELNSNNFYERTKDGVWLVDFVAPWCGHCKKLAPVWEEVATKLKTGKTRVHVGSVDATQSESLAKSFQISGYPTIVKLSDGNSETYEGSRTKEALIEWAAVPVVTKTLTEKATDLATAVYNQVVTLVTTNTPVAAVLVLLGFLAGMLSAFVFFRRTKIIYVDDPGLEPKSTPISASVLAPASPPGSKKKSKKVD